MTNIDVKTVGELFKSVGPTEEHRQKFGQTLPGSLLGQAVVAVGLLVLYCLLVILLLQQLTRAFEQSDTVWLWPAVTAPLVLILLFQILPTYWRARRERRLKRSAIGGDLLLKPGAFRLHPYGEADRDVFKRLDGAHVTLVNWLRSTQASLLYLSGASGVGKSSLLGADVLPALRDAGWAVVEMRLFGDPTECLRAALLKTKGIFTRKPAAELSPWEHLKKTAETRFKAGAPPLLIVIDQFEEFLVLQKEGEPVHLFTFVADLANRPIEGLRFLLVFRSDYRPLVFKLGLPPLMAGKNWQEVMPYRRVEATSLLQGGGRELSPEAWDDLFRGLDRIEDTRGLYRPITLNMIGLVLERMGPTLKGDPAQLIQSYLTACITGSESRDFAKPVLKRMISNTGTKERRSEADLVALTGLRSWQVRATLADLHWHGLIRRLEGAEPAWEIAHDFLARTIGQLIGRLKPTVVQRVRPLVAPVLLLGWLVAAFQVLPYWQMAPVRDLRKLGVEAEIVRNGSIIVLFPSPTQDETLRAAKAHLKRLPGWRLDLRFSSATMISNLDPLKELSNAWIIQLARGPEITSLEPLESLTNLDWLDLSEMPNITSLEPLKGLKKLTALTLVDMPRITSLEPLKDLTSIRKLELIGDVGIRSLEPLKNLANITFLDLRETSITSLEPLQGLTKLESLELGGIDGIASLEPLRGLTNLTTLGLGGNITSLEPLAGLTNLRELRLVHAAEITSLEPLRALTNLATLTLRGTQRIKSVEPLKGLTSLRTLVLTGVQGITSLEPLKDTNIHVHASEELRATMK